jgi:hypothetical protein
MEPCGKISPVVLNYLLSNNLKDGNLSLDVVKLTNHIDNCPRCRSYIESLSLKNDLKFIQHLTSLGISSEKISIDLYQESLQEPNPYLNKLIELTDEMRMKQGIQQAMAYYNYYLPHNIALEVTGSKEKSRAYQTQADVEYYRSLFNT